MRPLKSVFRPAFTFEGYTRNQHPVKCIFKNLPDDSVVRSHSPAIRAKLVPAALGLHAISLHQGNF
jgi:hypothetical protein